MSLEGIREAYQQIQEQGGSYRGGGRAAFRDLNRNPIPTAPKAPMSAAGALGTTGDALGLETQAETLFLLLLLEQ